MATQQVKRMIGIPAEVNKPWANSTIAWGTGITKTPVPPSVSNPASLTPWVTTPQPIAPKPVYGNNTAGINAVNQWAKNVNLNPDWTHKVTPAPTTITWATPRTWLPAQPWMLDINDPNNYNLTWYTVDDFLKLDSASQIKANAFGESQNKDLLGTTNDLRYTNEVNANKDFLDKQNTINQETAKLNNQNAEIARQQTMRAEEKSVRDLAQNVWFLWSQGRPVQSTWMMNAYADAINESNQKLSEIRTIQDNMRSMQELWIEFDANQYTEQIRRLNQDLKDKTWQVFQDAINAYNAEERAWMIDSPSKMLKLQQEILARADFSVAWFVQKNLDDIRVMNDNITSHIEAVKVEAAQAEVLRKEQAQTQAEFVKNQNTVNKDMSQALWHYVNGNGQALTTTEWAIIPFAKDMPNPSYDPNTWVAVVRQADAQGNPVPVIQQIAPMSQDYKMWLQLKQAQLNKIQQDASPTIETATWRMQRNPATQRYDIPVQGNALTWVLWDLRSLASQYPWQARAKNNNPAWITWNANFDKWTGTAWLLAQAGISYSKGTARPASEWGNYVTFPTIEDWLAAQRIMMTQTYGNSTVWNMLAKWVWTGEWPRYAQQVAWMAGVDVNSTVNQLSDQQLQTLQMAKIQKESPWLAKILQQQSKQTNQYSTSKDATKEITWLRKEFNALPEVKNYKQVVTSYKTIEEQAKKATPAGDLSMIFAYMKLLDPTSTVREWEFANAQNAASIPDQIVNAYNKAKEGTRLNDKQRQDFLNGAKTQLQSYENQYNKALEEYNTYVTAWWDPSQIGTFWDVSWSNVTKWVDIALQAWWQTQPNTTPSNQWSKDADLDKFLNI